MAPTLESRSALVARSPSMSPGAIAGAVIGAFFGGGFVLIVLGFLYFRYRRLFKEWQAEDGPETKPTASHRRNSLSDQAIPPEEPPAQQVQRQASIKDEKPSQHWLGRGGPADSRSYATRAFGDDSMRGYETIPAQQQQVHQGYYPGDITDPSQSQTISGSQQQTLPLSLDVGLIDPAAANSSYYDTRISMESDPVRPPVPLSRQMSELYEAQLKQSREKKGSGSSFKRILDYTFGRKRSTHTSTNSPHSARTANQQFFPTSPIDGSSGIKQESDTDDSRGVPSSRTGQFTTEPEEIDQETQGTQENAERGPKVIPPYKDAGLRQTTETDSDLPPVDFGPNAVASSGSSYGLPPVGTHPAAAQPPSRVQERLQSPDIPEPMDIDTSTQAPGPSGLRTSHSPSLSETFVSPMKIMNPSTATEKAAYTEYQIENSASPPPMLPDLEIQNSDRGPDAPSIAVPVDDDDDVDVDDYLDIPSPDEPRQSSDSFDFSTTPGQSSTDPSSGRTPDTRITASPSPYPAGPTFLPVKHEPESSTSPESTRLSPHSGKHICDECQREFDQPHKLNHHKRYHDRKHNCPYDGCDKRFGTKTHLDRHINDKHLKTKAYHCTDPSCPYFKGGKAFPRKDNWRRHMTNKHRVTPDQLEAMDQSVG
ncbi:hypothetical protein SLS62_001342 [Diatrype stigma]|uniref:C2H2-type domain-containing protein n=1 Tax=Diatrype stigma TaxID=117547 RepID=A0AAN9UY46_9PEZI